MKNLSSIFRLGILSYTMILLISCEPEEVATTNYLTKEGIQDTDSRTSKTEQLEFIFDRASRTDGAHNSQGKVIFLQDDLSVFSNQQ